MQNNKSSLVWEITKRQNNLIYIMRILEENNSYRQRYLYNCKCFSYENPDPENKVHGKFACSDYIGSMKKVIDVESPTEKK